MIDRRAAKELGHIQEWLKRVEQIVGRGKKSYLSDAILQEAGDSLMMKLGEAAARIAKLSVLAPDSVRWATAIANRNFLIHQYDQIDREITWATLSRDLPEWQKSLKGLFATAAEVLGGDDVD